MYVALIKKVYKEEFCMTEGEVIEAVIFRLYFDLKNMTWSGKSQGKVREFFIVYLLATLHDLDLEFSTSNLEIAVSQEWEGRLTWNQRDVSR